MLARRAALAIATSASLIAAIGGAATACSQAYAAADPSSGVDGGVDAMQAPPDGSPNDEAGPTVDAASEAGPLPANVVVLASGYSIVSAIAADDTNVYFADEATGGVHKVPLTGGAVLDLVQGSGAPSSLAVAGGSVYWTDTSGKTVSKIATTGGNVWFTEDGRVLRAHK